MKTEFRVAASSAVSELVAAAFPTAELGLVGKKDCFIIDSGKVDENGRPIYCTIEVTAKNTDPTTTAPAFDKDAAIQAYAEKVANAASKPKKESKGNQDAVKEANKAKREARQAVLREWIMTEMEEGKEYTSTEIHDLVPQYANDQPMTVGTDMIAMNGEMLVEFRMEKGKKYWSKR